MLVRYDVALSNYSCEVRGDFRCHRCGHQDEYRFVVMAQGQATVGATTRDSTEVARERAKKIAASLSRHTIAMLRCPKCHRMNPGAVGRYLRAQWAAWLLSSLFAGGAAGLALARDGSPALWAALTFVVTALWICTAGFLAVRRREVTFASLGPGAHAVR